MGRPKSKFKRLKKFSAPAHDKELSDYAEACAVVKMEPADTLRKLAAAFVEHVKAHKTMTVPIRFDMQAKRAE